MEIPIKTGMKINKRTWYPIPEQHVSEVKRQMRELENAGHIRKSKSSYSAPVVVASKKNGEWRLCIDYRALNYITVRDEFSLPVIHKILTRLHGCKWFSTLDLKSAYAHVPIAEKDKHKTAFRVNNVLYEWNVMPFGLTNAPPTFQRIMQQIFGDLENV